MDSEIRAALEQIIALDEKMCGRGTRLLRAVASEAEDALALLPAAGEPAVGAPDGASDPSREILLRADPSATVAFYPLPDAVGAPDGASDPSREILLRADPSATVAFYPLPDGKLRLSCGAWEDTRVMLAGTRWIGSTVRLSAPSPIWMTGPSPLCQFQRSGGFT